MVKICKLCEKQMVRRTSAKGEFYGCSGYPACKHTEPIEETAQPQASNQATATSQHTVVLNKTEKPHSYELGSAGNRFKIYFSDASDLKTQIDELIAKGFNPEQPEPIKPENFEG